MLTRQSTASPVVFPLSPASQLLIAARLLENCAAKFAQQAESLKLHNLAEASVRCNDHALETLRVAEAYRQQAARVTK